MRPVARALLDAAPVREVSQGEQQRGEDAEDDAEGERAGEQLGGREQDPEREVTHGYECDLRFRR